MYNQLILKKSLLLLLGFLFIANVSLKAQYGIYLMNPAYYKAHKIKTAKVFKQFEEKEMPVAYYQFNKKTSVVNIIFYVTPDRKVEMKQAFRLDAKDNFMPLDPETLKEIDDPYRFKLVDHFMYNRLNHLEYSETYDKDKRVIHDTVCDNSYNDEDCYLSRRYDFFYEGKDLVRAYYWKYDLLGFFNDIQRTDYTWSEDHLSMVSYTFPIKDHDDLVADMSRILPYYLRWFFNKKGMLIRYETEDSIKEEFRFEYK